MMSVRRTSWRTVQSQVDKEQEAGSEQAPLLAQYQQTVAAEICAVIDKVSSPDPSALDVCAPPPERCLPHPPRARRYALMW